MSKISLAKITGLLFISGAVAVNIPYYRLIATFNYPDVLREAPATILTQFHAGGTPLLLTWLAFAWTGFPLLLGIVLLHQILQEDGGRFTAVATTLGISGAIMQMVGLLRWVFVVPVLANAYVDAAATEAGRAAVSVVFQAVHQYGGVVIGEHLGQLLTIGWMLLVSASLLRSSRFPRLLGVLGIGASAIYALAQLELLATVIPGLANWEAAGFIGSSLWLVWMILLGLSLVRARPEAMPAAQAAGAAV